LATPRERIEQAILLIRGHRVMLSTDRADLYAVEPRVLVQGVAMLSSVLRSKELFKSTLASCGRVSPSRNDRFEQQASETLTDLEEKYDAQCVLVVEAIREFMAEPDHKSRCIGFRM
jgi:hypothetical protein